MMHTLQLCVAESPQFLRGCCQETAISCHTDLSIKLLKWQLVSPGVRMGVGLWTKQCLSKHNHRNDTSLPSPSVGGGDQTLLEW